MNAATARLVAAATARLAGMPTHSVDPARRPVVVVARQGRRRPVVLERCESAPLGASLTIEGFDTAAIVAG